MDGRSITNLTDLNHGSFHVISGTNKFIELNYGQEEESRKPFTNPTFMIKNMTADDIKLMKPMTPKLPPQPPPPPLTSTTISQQQMVQQLRNNNRQKLVNVNGLPPMSSSVPPSSPPPLPFKLDSSSLVSGQALANRGMKVVGHKLRNGMIKNDPTGGKLVTVINNNNHDVV